MASKRWFAIAAVSGLTGLVASACSDDDATPPAVDDAGSDASRPDTSPPPDPPTNCPLQIEFKTSEVEAELKGAWKPPKPTPKACTADEIAKFGQNIDSSAEETPIADLAKDLSAGCKTCLFSTTTDSQWQLIVSVSGGQPNDGFINFGACHAVVNGSADCGRNYQYNQFCVETACQKCTSGDAIDRCATTVREKDAVCSSLNTAMQDSCANLIQSETSCGRSAVDHATVLCGAGVPDGGVFDGGFDAGADAGADADAGRDAGKFVP